MGVRQFLEPESAIIMPDSMSLRPCVRFSILHFMLACGYAKMAAEKMQEIKYAQLEERGMSHQGIAGSALKSAIQFGTGIEMICSGAL